MNSIEKEQKYWSISREDGVGVMVSYNYKIFPRGGGRRLFR